MKKLIGLLAVLITLFMANQAQALSGRAWSENIGYSQARFHIDSADPDSGTVPKKVVLFYGTSLTNMIRKDSLTTVTDPDSIAKAVGTFAEGTTYYWYMSVHDSANTLYIPFDYKTAPYSFTTTDLQQNTTASSVGYSTANIIVDSTGLSIGVGIDSVRLDYDKTDGTTYVSSITTVTYPDTFAVTGLDEGATYYYRTIAFLTDSSAADTLTAATFTTTDLQYSVTTLSFNADSLVLIVDTTNADLAVDSLIWQWGAGLRGITANTSKITSVTEPDTIIITGIIEGSTISFRLMAHLPDSAAIETTTVLTYTRAHNKFIAQSLFEWPSNSDRYEWDFNMSSDGFSTGPIPIESEFLRFNVAIDGEDDAATYDSLEVFLWSFKFGDSTIVDTLVAADADTITITPLSYRTWPGNAPDTSLDVYPQFDWGTHYSVSAAMTDSSASAADDLVLGIRSVHVIIEEIK